MTDERLDQILKQALSPEIDDSEIKLRGKVRKKKMNIKKVVTYGIVACAALLIIAVAGIYTGILKTDDGKAADYSNSTEGSIGNLFAITAYAAELPDEVSSGDVISISALQSGYGSSEYLEGRFVISGKNIENVKISTDKCNMYSAVPVYKEDAEFEKAEEAVANGEADEYIMIADADLSFDEIKDGPVPYHYEHVKVVGDTYEGAYNEKMQFGLSVPEELRSKSEDDPTAYHEDVDQVDGATLTVEVTFSDNTKEIHRYKLNTGKIFVPSDENGILQWDNLTRFVESDDEPYTYGFLMEKVD